MENTLENKAQFFAQYYGQQIGIDRMAFYAQVGDALRPSWINQFTLMVKPLSSITDEDAVEVAALCGEKHEKGKVFSYSATIQAVKESLTEAMQQSDFHLPISVIDYLRSKGYALPFHNLSVEKLIEYGWIKLQVPRK